MIDEKLLQEAYRPIDKILWLVKNGLGRDQTKMMYYQQAIQNPQITVQQVAFRGYVAEVLDKLCDLIFTDPILYARVAALLASKKRPASPVALRHPHGRARIRPKAWESLQKKADSSGVELKTLVEVYDKGFNDTSRPMHLTPEQFAYNRVNSYIAKGKARRLEEQETVNNQYNTLKTIQKVVRNRK